MHQIIFTFEFRYINIMAESSSGQHYILFEFSSRTMVEMEVTYSLEMLGKIYGNFSYRYK